ncbi:MAG: MbcA/ParS/Xre antitoxin family protein [Thioalkalivibrio sp.]
MVRIFEKDTDRAIEWMKKPNRAFGGKSALNLMLSGDIEQVRKHVTYHLYNA